MPLTHFSYFSAFLLVFSVQTGPTWAETVVWPVSPLAKVFRDGNPPERVGTGTIHMEAAANEYEPAQLAVRSSSPLKGLRTTCAPLTSEDGKSVPSEAITAHFLGYLPIEHNTAHAESVWLRKAPCEIPDFLLEAPTMDLAAETTQPVWITVRVPKGTSPGVYQGAVSVSAEGFEATVPVELSVFAFELPEKRHLFVTHWFRPSRIADYHGVEPWSEPFWEILAKYAENLAAHRQNVIQVPWNLIEVTREADGALTYDYSRFDRYIEVFEKAGAADMIELTHVGHFGEGGWSGSEIVLGRLSATDAQTKERISLDFDEGLKPFLGALERHLEETGRLKKSAIHVADEPSINNVESFRKVSAKVREAAPGLRRMDAIETIDFTGALEIWIPKLSHYERWRDAYEERRGDNQFWFYICCHPVGPHYPNRFVDLPLSNVRVLHWINFEAELKGYLHWALFPYSGDPFAAPPKHWSPGDDRILYPGKNGPMNGLRWEMQRESLEDFEYLHLLCVKTDELKKSLGDAAAFVHTSRRGKELCRRIVPSIGNINRDPATIMETRRAIAEEIAALDRKPLLLFETEPPEGTVLIHGPINVEVRGITEPGAAVTINGDAVSLGPDGRFAKVVFVHSKDHAEIKVEVEKDGHKKTHVRRFPVRD